MVKTKFIHLFRTGYAVFTIPTTTLSILPPALGANFSVIGCTALTLSCLLALFALAYFASFLHSPLSPSQGDSGGPDRAKENFAIFGVTQWILLVLCAIMWSIEPFDTCQGKESWEDNDACGGELSLVVGVVCWIHEIWVAAWVLYIWN